MNTTLSLFFSLHCLKSSIWALTMTTDDNVNKTEKKKNILFPKDFKSWVSARSCFTSEPSWTFFWHY